MSLWRPSASLALLRARAELLARIRIFFDERQVLEVETPILSTSAPSEPAIAPLPCRYQSQTSCWLNSSPEFAMKRLLAAGTGPIYQLGKVFRNGEFGRLHNPEFTMLEWYRPGFSLDDLMTEVAALVACVSRRDWPINQLSYRELFLEHLGLDPFQAEAAQLEALARSRGIDLIAETMDRDAWLDLLLSHLLQPLLGQGALSFVHGYPPSQAALAQLRDTPYGPVAERFELYMEGIEIANGYAELTDANEQRQRFMHDLERRRRQGLPEPRMDEHFLAALEAGLPQCSGVALGVDRLLMVLQGCTRLDEVLAFPFDRA
jgi:lysyl-tRNA synthetase class 2